MQPKSPFLLCYNTSLCRGLYVTQRVRCPREKGLLSSVKKFSAITDVRATYPGGNNGQGLEAVGSAMELFAQKEISVK